MPPETVGRITAPLAADKRAVEQERQVLFALIHADITAGADTDAVRLVDQHQLPLTQRFSSPVGAL